MKSYQIGKQKFTEDKVKNMSGTDANALYYATHQGNRKANTMATNPGAYVETDKKTEPTKEEYDSLVRQIKQIQKNMNEPKREIPKLEKPAQEQQYTDKDKYAFKAALRDDKFTASKMAVKDELRKESQKQSDMLDYYDRKELDEEYNNLKAKGQGMSSLDAKRLREINSLYEKDNKARDLTDIPKKQDNYLVHKDRYDALMQNDRLKNDIDTLVNVIYNNADQDATVSPEWAAEYGARAFTGGLSMDDFITQLSKRYELTPAELKDMAFTRKAELQAESDAKDKEAYNQFAKAHPILGTAGSYLGTVGSGGEGLYNVVAGGLTGDDRFTSRMFNNVKSGLREGAKENINSNAGKVIYDLATGLGDMGIGAAMGSAPAVLAGNTTNNAYLTSLDNGANVRNASLYATGAGIADYIFNKKGLDKAKDLVIDNLKSAGWKKALGSTAWAGGFEGLENGLQDVAQSFLDQVINGENSELQTSYANKIASGMSEDKAFAETVKEYGAQLGMSAGTGFLMGATRQGVPTLVKNYGAKLANIDLEKNRNNVWDDVEKFEQGENAEITSEDVNSNGLNNDTNESYNEVTGGIANGEGRITDDGTGSEDVLRGIREGESVSEELRGNEPQGRGQLQGNSVFSTDELANNAKAFDDNDIEILKKNDIETPNFVETNNNAKRFADAFEDARQSNKNGAAVDARDANDIQEIIDNGGKVFLTEDGTMGYAVEENGNLTAVFKHSSNKTKGMAARATLAAIKNGAFKGDCYGRKLVNMYSMAGFEPVGRMKYAYGFNDAMDAQVKQQMADGIISKEPDVYVLKLRDGYDFNKAASEFKNAKQYSQAELDALPDYTDVEDGYKKMLADRDAKIKQPNEVASSMPENTELADYRARRDALIDAQKGMNMKEQIENLNQIRAMDAEMAEQHPEWFRDGKFVGDEVRQDFSNEMEEAPTEETPVENPEEVAETPKTTDVPEETTNRLKMNLQFFAELMQEKERLKLKLTDKGVKLSERRAINNRIADIDKQLTNYRKTITNTAVKAGIVTMEDIENDPELSKIVNYVVHHNAEVVAQARQNLADNGEQIKNDYISGKTEIKTDQDADQAMLLLSGEYGDLDNYERNAILKNLAEHGTEAGQFIQALSKYSNTKEGALISATKIMNDEVKYWASRNKRAVGINGKLAEALKMQGYDGTMDLTKPKPTFDELRQQIRNTLSEEYSSIENQFTDSDIDYLAHMIEHNATIGDLTEALNTKMATGKFGISDETQAEINRLFEFAKQFDENSEDYVKAQAEAFRLLAEEVAPSASPLEKFDAWRYIAMLGNPKTMLRNFIGNKMFSVITGVSNNLAALMEAGADNAVKFGKKASNKMFKTNYDTSKGIQRTKYILNPVKDRSLLKATKADAYNKRARQIEGSKYEKMDKDALRRNRSVFDSDVMKLVEKAVDRGISDTKAVVNKYSTSMAGYMKANGITEADIKDSYRYDALKRKSQNGMLLSPAEKAEMDDLHDTATKVDKARDYALKQAEYATFHEDSKIADVISKFSRINMGTKVLTEGLVPFKKTPINIIRSGIEYSPLGALKSIAQTGKLVYENTGNRRTDLPDTYQVRNPVTRGYKDVNRTLASDVIESWSRTLTGSGLAALGYYLFNKGILHSSTKDEKYQDDLEGKQNYSIEINGKTYTIDWAVPGSMPLLLGAEIKKAMDANAISDEKWYENIDGMFGTIDGLLEPVIETSMLQGMKNTIDTFSDKYDDAGTVEKIVNAGSTLGVNYLSQALPTLVGQFSRAFDNTRRSTDTVNTGLVGNLEKQGRKVMNKTPLSVLNNPYVNARGEQEQNAPYDNLMGRLAYQTLSPWYAQDIDTRPSDEIARNAYRGLDVSGKPIMDADVFADWKSNVKINGVKLTPDEMFNYRTAAGQANTAIREALATQDWFNDAPAETQNEILKNTNTLVDHIGKTAVNPEYATDSEAFAAYESNGVQGVIDYYQNKAHKAEVKRELGTSSDWARAVYDTGNQSLIDKFKKGNEIAKEAGFDGLSEKQWKVYSKGNESALRSELKYASMAKEAGVEDSELFRDAMNSHITPEAYKKEDDAIKSIQIGVDKYGDPKYMEHNNVTADIYRKDGLTGLNDYATIQKKGYGKTTYEAYKHAKAQKNNNLSLSTYLGNVADIERYNPDKKPANGEVSQGELLGLFNARGFSQSQALDYWNTYLTDYKKVPVLNKKGKWTTK